MSRQSDRKVPDLGQPKCDVLLIDFNEGTCPDLFIVSSVMVYVNADWQSLEKAGP